MNSLNHIATALSFLALVISCSQRQQSTEPDSGLIEITNLQFTTDRMQLGEVEERVFERSVKCNGILVPLPNGKATVNALLPGVIKNILCHDGQLVRKNQALMEISGNEIIDIQRELAEASANYLRIKMDYERIKSLYNENVTSVKEYLLSESEYKTSFAVYQSLKMKVEALDLPVSKIEQGEFFSTYTIKSPINGYVSQLNINIGSYVDQQSALTQITDPTMFQLQLSIFASDIAGLERGQTVRYKAVNSKEVQQAVLSSVGVVVDQDSKSITCFAAMKEDNPIHPIANEFIESEIVIGMDTVQALPAEAILKSETGHYVMVLDRKAAETYYFRKEYVTVGRQYNGFSELLGKVPEGRVIVKGAYNILL